MSHLVASYAVTQIVAGQVLNNVSRVRSKVVRVVEAKSGCRHAGRGRARQGLAAQLLVSSAWSWRLGRGEVSTPTTPCSSNFTPLPLSLAAHSWQSKCREDHRSSSWGGSAGGWCCAGGVTGPAPAGGSCKPAATYQLIKTTPLSSSSCSCSAQLACSRYQ